MLIEWSWTCLCSSRVNTWIAGRRQCSCCRRSRIWFILFLSISLPLELNWLLFIPNSLDSKRGMKVKLGKGLCTSMPMRVWCSKEDEIRIYRCRHALFLCCNRICWKPPNTQPLRDFPPREVASVLASRQQKLLKRREEQRPLEVKVPATIWMAAKTCQRKQTYPLVI